MSTNWKYDTELQLMEVSQDCTSITHQQHNKLWISPAANHSADDWNDSWGDNMGGDDFVDLDDLVNTDLDSDIIDFSIDEY